MIGSINNRYQKDVVKKILTHFDLCNYLDHHPLITLFNDRMKFTEEVTIGSGFLKIIAKISNAKHKLYKKIALSSLKLIHTKISKNYENDVDQSVRI